MSWNVHGLGDLDKCTIVRDAIRSTTPSVVCLQATKLSECEIFKAATFLPQNMSSSFCDRGSPVLLAPAVACSLPGIQTFSPSLITVMPPPTAFLQPWPPRSLIIYAPSDHRQTPAFLSQLAKIANLFTSAPHGSTLSLVTLVSPSSAAAVPAARAA